MSNYKCKLATNQTYSFFSFGFQTHTHTHTYLCVFTFLHIFLKDVCNICSPLWCRHDMFDVYVDFFRKVTGTHPQSPTLVLQLVPWSSDSNLLFSPTSSWMRKGWRWEKRWQGQQRTAKTHGWSWLCPLVQADAIGRIQHRQSDVWEDKMCVFFGFLLVFHALQWWRGGEFRCFQQFWVLVLFISCWSVADFHYFGGSVGPWACHTSLMFVFCHKEVPFRHFGKVRTAVLCRSMPGIMGSRVLPFPGVGVDFSL